MTRFAAHALAAVLAMTGAAQGMGRLPHGDGPCMGWCVDVAWDWYTWCWFGSGMRSPMQMQPANASGVPLDGLGMKWNPWKPSYNWPDYPADTPAIGIGVQGKVSLSGSYNPNLSYRADTPSADNPKPSEPEEYAEPTEVDRARASVFFGWQAKQALDRQLYALAEPYQNALEAANKVAASGVPRDQNTALKGLSALAEHSSALQKEKESVDQDLDEARRALYDAQDKEAAAKQGTSKPDAGKQATGAPLQQSTPQPQSTPQQPQTPQQSTPQQSTQQQQTPQQQSTPQQPSGTGSPQQGTAPIGSSGGLQAPGAPSSPLAGSPADDGQPPITIFVKARAWTEDGKQPDVFQSASLKLPSRMPDLPFGNTRLDLNYDKPPMQATTDGKGDGKIEVPYSMRVQYGLTDAKPGSFYSLGLTQPKITGAYLEMKDFSLTAKLPDLLRTKTPPGLSLMDYEPVVMGTERWARVSFAETTGANSAVRDSFREMLAVAAMVGVDPARMAEDWCRTKLPAVDLEPGTSTATGQQIPQVTLKLAGVAVKRRAAR